MRQICLPLLGWRVHADKRSTRIAAPMLSALPETPRFHIHWKAVHITSKNQMRMKRRPNQSSLLSSTKPGRISETRLSSFQISSANSARGPTVNAGKGRTDRTEPSSSVANQMTAPLLYHRQLLRLGGSGQLADPHELPLDSHPAYSRRAGAQDPNLLRATRTPRTKKTVTNCLTTAINYLGLRFRFH